MRPPASGRWRPQRRDRHLRLVDRGADQLDRGRGLQRRQSRRRSTPSTAPAPATGSPCSARARSTSATPRAPSARKRSPLCEENGISYIELQIGIDGLSVITSPENADVTCLSFGDLYALLGPESQGFDNWSDADALADEIGADFGEIHAPYPDAELVDHRSRRGVGHVRQLRRARHRRPRRGARPGRDDAARLPVVGRRQRHHREHRRLAEHARLGRLRLRRREQRQRDVARGRRRRRLRGAHAGDDRLRRVPDRAARSSSTSTPTRPRPDPSSLPSSTSTSPTRASLRSPRPTTSRSTEAALEETRAAWDGR